MYLKKYEFSKDVIVNADTVADAATMGMIRRSMIPQTHLIVENNKSPNQNVLIAMAISEWVHSKKKISRGVWKELDCVILELMSQKMCQTKLKNIYYGTFSTSTNKTLVNMGKKDACYHSVKARYNVWPSARASQALAKCRKSKGHVKKTKAGTNLKRWTKEKWKDTKTGKPCGHSGPGTEYCRPSKKVSKKHLKCQKDRT